MGSKALETKELFRRVINSPFINNYNITITITITTLDLTQLVRAITLGLSHPARFAMHVRSVGYSSRLMTYHPGVWCGAYAAAPVHQSTSSEKEKKNKMNAPETNPMMRR